MGKALDINVLTNLLGREKQLPELFRKIKRKHFELLCLTHVDAPNPCNSL